MSFQSDPAQYINDHHHSLGPSFFLFHSFALQGRVSPFVPFFNSNLTSTKADFDLTRANNRPPTPISRPTLHTSLNRLRPLPELTSKSFRSFLRPRWGLLAGKRLTGCPSAVTRTNKGNDRNHSALADGTAVAEDRLPRYFAKHGHVDADPKAVKKQGGGKGNW